jgi:hypothetical protein
MEENKANGPRAGERAGRDAKCFEGTKSISARWALLEEVEA